MPDDSLLQLKLTDGKYQELVELVKLLSRKNHDTYESTLDCIATGIIRGVYYPLDNVGLDCENIKSDYESLKDSDVWYDILSFYKAVVAELKRVTSLSS